MTRKPTRPPTTEETWISVCMFVVCVAFWYAAQAILSLLQGK